jgi:hypothetical protein
VTEVVFHRSRWLSGFYFVMTFVTAAFAILFAMIAVGNAVEKSPWSDKGWNVAAWIVGALSWGFGAPQMWQMGRSYKRSYVAVGADTLRIRVSESEGEVRVPLSGILGITLKRSIRFNTCTLTTADARYVLTKENCSHADRVAALIAERSGKPLELEA